MFGIVFTPNFTECLQERFDAGIRVDDEVLDCTMIKTYADTTLPVHLWTFVYMFLNSFRGMVHSYLKSIPMNPEAYLPALDFYDQNGKAIPYEFSMGTYILLGLVSLTILFLLNRNIIIDFKCRFLV